MRTHRGAVNRGLSARIGSSDTTSQDAPASQFAHPTTDGSETDNAQTTTGQLNHGTVPETKVFTLCPSPFLHRAIVVVDGVAAMKKKGHDMLDRPEFIQDMVKRYVETQMAQLDQLEELDLLSPGNSNVRVGSGGYGYTRELPESTPTGTCTPSEMWGCSNAQIFAEISPEMHWELALQHEIPWLERWGMNDYGCCEQLHSKIELLHKIPRLRKVSLSPRCDISQARENGADNYVLSIKPNPAIMVPDRWDPDQHLRRHPA